VVRGVSFECGHQAERKFGAVESQATWCRYTPDRRSAILREIFSLSIITKSLVILVFRHTGDDTTLLSACLSSSVGTKCVEIRTSCLGV